MKDNKQISAPCRKPYVAPASESIRLFAEGALLTGTTENIAGDDQRNNGDFEYLSGGRNKENPIWKNMN
ncbi:MAG: hypothetical protein PUJ30_02485 [Bacteroidales bacterium]|nr:hypothetical protein [Bacteroidales bacterium]MDY4620777.1 hypothetical protein [Alloprevotella sp.]